jgi:hypothetical protein
MPNPITPPPELVEKWYDAIDNSSTSWKQELSTRAAQWGADQELEACCAWIGTRSDWLAPELREARRPKPPSLKEQALKMLRPLSNSVMPGTPEYRLYEPQAEIIRRALEALPND